MTTAAAASCWLLTLVGDLYVFSVEFKVLLFVTTAAAASCWLVTLVCDLNVSSVSGYVSWNTGCRVPLLGGIVSLTHVAGWFTAAAFSAAAAFAAAWSRVAFSGFISLGSELAVFVLNCKFVDGTTELWGIMSLQGSHFAWSNQATPRVDVGGSPQASLQQAAAAFKSWIGSY